MSEEKSQLPCGPNADDRYCERYWELSAEVDRLRAAVAELLDSTGLDDDQQAEWLERAGITLPEVAGSDSEGDPDESPYVPDDAGEVAR